MKSLKWIRGPELPSGVKFASSVALSPKSIFVCVVIGGTILTGKNITEHFTPNVYGLNQSSKEWALVGKISTGRN